MTTGELKAVTAPRVSAGALLLVMGALVVAVAVPTAPIQPINTLDSSWRVAMILAASHHVQWGPDLAFTYGPLSYLTLPTVASVHLGYIALAFQALVRGILYVSLFVGLRRLMSAIWASLIAVAAVECLASLVVLGFGPLPIVLGVVWCYTLLFRDLPSRATTGLSCALGLLSALLFFVEPTPAALLLATSLIAAGFGPGRSLRVIGTCLAGFVAGIALFAAAAFQSLRNLGSLLMMYTNVVSGYSAAMSVTGRRRDFLLGACAVALVILSTFWATRGMVNTRRFAAYVIALMFLFVFFKEGFVRQDLGHEINFFGMCIFVVVAMLASRPSIRSSSPSILPPVRQTWPRPDVLVLALAGLCGLVVILPNPRAAAGTLRHALRQTASNDWHMLSPDAVHDQIATAQTTIRKKVPLPPIVLSELSRRQVYVEPWAENLAWAYGFQWSPPLVPQNYVAYTSRLDQRATTVLISPNGPDRILMTKDGTIDDRLWSFDPPGVQAAILCHFRQLYSSPDIQLLRRVTDRCSPPQLIEVAHPQFGQSVMVPNVRPGDMVIATFNLPSTLFQAGQSLLYKPAPTYLVADTGVRYRFVTSTAMDPHIMRPATTIGADSPWIPPTISSFRVEMPQASGPFTVSFYAVTVT